MFNDGVVIWNIEFDFLVKIFKVYRRHIESCYVQFMTENKK